MAFKIPFNKPYLTGKEAHYMYQAVYTGKLSGNGVYTQKCQKFFEQKYGFKKTLLTTSCTDALEMCAILCDVGPGDEVIVPSYTFVSSALAFVRQGCKIVFADSAFAKSTHGFIVVISSITLSFRPCHRIHFLSLETERV